MINGLIGNPQCGSSGEWFTASQVASESRVSAAGDLKPDAIPSLEAIGCWPEINVDLERAIWLRCWSARPQAPYSVTDIERLS